MTSKQFKRKLYRANYNQYQSTWCSSPGEAGRELQDMLDELEILPDTLFDIETDEDNVYEDYTDRDEF